MCVKPPTHFRSALTLVRLFALVTLLLAGQASAQTCPANHPAKVAPDNRYTVSEPVSGEFVVTDLETGLIWKQCPEGLSGSACATGSISSLTWTAAFTAANGSTHAGYSDWRLPSIIELQSLVETSCYSPSINTTRFPANGKGYYWSSSTYAPNASNAWLVNFVNGFLNANNKTDSVQVRLVRGGQWLDPFASELAAQAALTAAASPSSIACGETSTLSTSGGSGSGAVSCAVTAGGTYCSVSGSTLTGTGVGTCTVTATKAADTNYTAATDTVDVTVGLAIQDPITLTVEPAVLALSRTASLSVAGGSGTGVVSYSVTAGAGKLGTEGGLPIARLLGPRSPAPVLAPAP